MSILFFVMAGVAIGLTIYYARKLGNKKSGAMKRKNAAAFEKALAESQLAD